jgi:hypothetical protein
LEIRIRTLPAKALTTTRKVPSTKLRGVGGHDAGLGVG